MVNKQSIGWYMELFIGVEDDNDACFFQMYYKNIRLLFLQILLLFTIPFLHSIIALQWSDDCTMIFYAR